MLQDETASLPFTGWEQDRFAGDEPNRRWRVLYTKPRHEKAVARQILAKREQCYVPLFTKRVSFDGKNTTLLLPVFPGCVFAVLGEDELSIAWRTKCVVNIVDVGDGERMRRELGQIYRLL